MHNAPVQEHCLNMLHEQRIQTMLLEHNFGPKYLTEAVNYGK